MKRIRDYYCRNNQAHPDPARQSGLRKRHAHSARRKIRIAAIAFDHWIARYHSQKYDAAKLLELHPRTLGRWQQRWLDSKLRSKPHGRPFIQSQLEQRDEVKQLLDALGPHIGCSTLQIFFPHLCRRELRRILRRYRRIWRKRLRNGLHQLRWLRPGSVWGIDYTDPPAPIDGIYSSILVVRDLASGYQLLALPTYDQTAKTACDALLPLFRQFGPPLVLKSDNGSFRAHDFLRFLQQWNVCPFLSPPRTPQYNGAVEAGIGSIKTRAHHIAALHGRPGNWNCDDVEAARLLANSTARPNGPRTPHPVAAWKRRNDISASDRKYFFETIKLFQRRLDEKPKAAPPSPEPNPRTDRDPALFRRLAIHRALRARALLTIFKPRRITPPIKPQKVDRIS